MTIDYACPACDARLIADDEALGQTTFCSTCGKPAIVDPGTVPAPPGLDGKETELTSLLLIIIGIAVVAAVLSVVVGCALAWFQKASAAVTAPAAAPAPVPIVRKANSPQARGDSPRTSSFP